MEKEQKNRGGLTSKQAEERLIKDGYNELPSQKRRNFFFIFWEVIKEPMLLLLVAAGTIYFILGEPNDALMLSMFVVFIVGITFYQQRKTERALDALRDLSSPRALVIRDGIQYRIAGREVVVGDVMILREGDRVAADSAVLESINLMADESLLTGESLAVSKSVWDGVRPISDERPGGDNLMFVYSGTLVTRGHGLALVMATGITTEMGKIGKSLQGIDDEGTLLKKETGRLVKFFGGIGLALCILTVAFYLFFKGDLLQGILYGLTISMSMLPEEFPVVLLIFLTIGAWRMSKHKVLTRNTAAIETLGAADILCVDKTGTLTLNQMRLQSLAVDGGSLDLAAYDGDKKTLPHEYEELLEYSMLASQSDPFDPLEKEIKNTGKFFLSNTNHLHDNWKLVKEYPFSGNILALSHVWESGDGDRYVVAAKGAPESIADLCHIDTAAKDRLLGRMKPLLENGLRLIGVAVAGVAKDKLENCNQHDFDFEFVGLLGFADPIRPSVPGAIKECYSAGVRVCMITGDYPGTAQYIARAIGLNNPEEFLTGSDLQTMSKEELAEKLKTVNVFARVVPEQKMLLVKVFKESGLTIAMTGDGVNDAPALKAANIGIAMGERGTDVARETADLVLLNDDFTSIVRAIRMGRTIFDNIKKAVAYIFAVHIPIAGMSFLPVALNLPVVFFPAHIAFLELVIDPACSVVFENEPEEKNVMKRKPRRLVEPLFGKKSIIMGLLQGFGVLAAVFIVFMLSYRAGNAEGQVRALSFTAIVVANLCLIVANLSWGNPFKALFNGNRALLWIFISASVMLAVVLTFEPMMEIFHFDPIGIKDFTVAALIGMAGALWTEPFKLVLNRNKS